jgi:hypothetical protein
MTKDISLNLMCITDSHIILKLTRTKTSIRYAKENHREKTERRRERKKGRRRDIEREVKGIER